GVAGQGSSAPVSPSPASPSALASAPLSPAALAAAPLSPAPLPVEVSASGPRSPGPAGACAAASAWSAGAESVGSPAGEAVGSVSSTCCWSSLSGMAFPRLYRPPPAPPILPGRGVNRRSSLDALLQSLERGVDDHL